MAAADQTTALKDQGNALYKEGSYLQAAAAYTKAIKQDPQNHVLYRLVRRGSKHTAGIHLQKPGAHQLASSLRDSSGVQW